MRVKLACRCQCGPHTWRSNEPRLQMMSFWAQEERLINRGAEALIKDFLRTPARSDRPQQKISVVEVHQPNLMFHEKEKIK
jgi:hypothetical protein